MEKQIVHQVKRSDTEEVRVIVGTYKEKEYVDIRLFYHNQASDKWLPTKKGVTVHRKFLGGLLEGLTKAEEAFSQMAN